MKLTYYFFNNIHLAFPTKVDEYFNSIHHRTRYTQPCTECYEMMFCTFFVFIQLLGIRGQTILKGFELLDPQKSGYVAAEDSVVQAITPLATQLSLCYWFNQRWAGPTHFGGFELRTTMTQKRKSTPSNSNWPSLYEFGGSWGEGEGESKVGIMAVKYFSLKGKRRGINFARKWIHYCFSFEFQANEMQIAVNGEVFEKSEIHSTEKVYKDQLGGPEMLKESDASNFFFAFGRYWFDDARVVINSSVKRIILTHVPCPSSHSTCPMSRPMSQLTTDKISRKF